MVDAAHAPFVSTIIAPKGEKNLTIERVEEFRALLGAASAEFWLETGVACDIYHDLPHLGLDTDLDFDFVTQPTAHRRKRLLLADMDSTLIEQECIDELANYAGLKEEISGITERAMNGEMDFESALKARVALLKGIPESALAEVFETRISLMPGGKVLADTMKAHHAYLAIVSGGFTYFTSRVREALGFHTDRSNQLHIDNGVLTGHVQEPIFGQNAKLEALVEIASEHGLASEDVLAIGDGANDIPMLKAAGLGVACHAKPFVREQVEAQINHNDLSALLFVQGYVREEWVDA
jgi:phosphoserine phosphatase